MAASVEVRRRQIHLSAILLVVLATWVVAARSFVTADRQRLKLVETPVAASAGAVVISTSGAEPLAASGQSLALIARISNRDAQPHELTIWAGDVRICSRKAAASTTSRVDCAVSSQVLSTAPAIRVEGPGSGWSIEYLELATHHGNADGLIALLILPAQSKLGMAPSAAATALFATILLTVLLYVPAAPLSRRAMWIYTGIAAPLIGLFVVALLSPWVSAYRIILSSGTVMRLLPIIVLPRTITGWRWLAAPATGGRFAWLRPTIVALAVLGAFGTAMRSWLHDQHDGNYSGFLLVSRPFFDRNPLMRDRQDVRRPLKLGENGYDGQFAYFIAFDPLMRRFHDAPAAYRLVVDAVPYRFGRIGFSLLVRLIAGERWWRYPATMTWLVIVGAAVGAWGLAWLAQEAGLSPAVGALMLLVPGFWQSLQTVLPEPLAAALLVAGAALALRRQWGLSGAAFAASLLVRETGVVLLACVAVARFTRGERRQAVMWMLAVTVPMVVWRGYVGWTIFSDWGWRGFFDHPADLGGPLAGFLQLWREVASGTYYGGSVEFARAAIYFPLLLIAALVLSGWSVMVTRHMFAGAALAYGGLAICLNYPWIWVHVRNGQRGTYEVFLMLALSLLAWKAYSRRLRYASIVFWAACAGYVLYGSFDAAAFRAAVHLPF